MTKLRKLLRLLASALLYFCVATVLAQALGLVVLWSRGNLDRQTVTRLAAAVQEIDRQNLGDLQQQEGESAVREYPAVQDVLEARLRASLDLDLRENVVQRTLKELHRQEADLEQQQQQYEQARNQFDDRLDELAAAADDQALEEVRRTLESIPARQAKQQIIRMLDDDALGDVVALLKAMNLDKRKRILEEFKTEEEARRLHEILREIRRGAPRTTLIQNTRNQLEPDDGQHSL